jgi:hypothetical protein
MGRGRQLFYEAQRFPRRIAIALAIPPFGLLALLVWQVLLGHQWGKHPMSNASVIGWTVFTCIIFLRLLTVRLVTEVRDADLFVSLRGLWPARRIPLGDIQSVETVTFDPERDYGGYGIRSTSQGKAYLAGGHRGVRIKLANSAVLVLGSQRPEDLRAILVGPGHALPRNSTPKLK